MSYGSSRCGFAKYKTIHFKFLLHPQTWKNPWTQEFDGKLKKYVTKKYKDDATKEKVTWMDIYHHWHCLSNDFQSTWTLKFCAIEISWVNQKTP